MSTWKWWILYDFMVNPCKSHPFDGYLDVTINFQVDANEGTETQRGSSLRSAWSTLPCSEEKRFGLLWLFCDCFLYMGDLILYIVFFDSWILAISYLADSIDDCRPLHRIPMFIQVCSVVTLSIYSSSVVLRIDIGDPFVCDDFCLPRRRRLFSGIQLNQPVC